MKMNVFLFWLGGGFADCAARCCSLPIIWKKIRLDHQPAVWRKPTHSGPFSITSQPSASFSCSRWLSSSSSTASSPATWSPIRAPPPITAFRSVPSFFFFFLFSLSLSHFEVKGGFMDRERLPYCLSYSLNKTNPLNVSVERPAP